jgi:hypothetical protein
VIKTGALNNLIKIATHFQGKPMSPWFQRVGSLDEFFRNERINNHRRAPLFYLILMSPWLLVAVNPTDYCNRLLRFGTMVGMFKALKESG